MLGNSARAAGVGTRFVLLVGYMGGQNAETEVYENRSTEVSNKSLVGV